MSAPHHPCFAAGYHDAQRGHTACPFGEQWCAIRWAQGYDLAADNGEALFTRFGKLRTKRR